MTIDEVLAKAQTIRQNPDRDDIADCLRRLHAIDAG